MGILIFLGFIFGGFTGFIISALAVAASRNDSSRNDLDK